MEQSGKFWTWDDHMEVDEGSLRLLSAWEVLEARREGEALALDGKDRALCHNACLIAKALERKGRPVYADGREALNGLRVEDIVRLSAQWAQFNRRCNPSSVDTQEALDRRKKAWSTRFMSAFNGACSACLALFQRRNGSKR